MICCGIRVWRYVRFVTLTLLLTSCPPVRSQEHSGGQLSASQIAVKMEQKNEERARALAEFSGSRIYRMEYRGFSGNKDAEMTVEMNFRAPAQKNFKVISQTGPKWIIERVFKKLLQTEQEAQQEENRRQTALTEQNYEFSLAGYEHRQEGDCYVLTVTPRTKNKLLYQGKIWVSTSDFAVTHIEAEPAKSPSFWITKTKIAHDYAKVGDFWLPARNRSESHIRLGGWAVLVIEYLNYKIAGQNQLATNTRK